MARILVVEDDIAFADAVVKCLELESHSVDSVSSGEDAVQKLKNSIFDIVVLDWQLPGISGYEVLDSFRGQGGTTPVLFLTGRKDQDSKSAGLDCGADDYMVKPFSPRELSARIRALLRRPAGLLPSLIECGDVRLEVATGRVTLKGVPARFTSKELAVVEFLMRHPNRIFSSSEVLDAVWPSSTESSENAVRQVIKSLRRKFDAAGADFIVKTSSGGGYFVETAGKKADS
jgi:two-component system, OmpR family, response regulator